MKLAYECALRTASTALDENSNAAQFKPSVDKKNVDSTFLPINCCVQQMSVSRIQGPTASSSPAPWSGVHFLEDRLDATIDEPDIFFTECRTAFKKGKKTWDLDTGKRDQFCVNYPVHTYR